MKRSRIVPYHPIRRRALFCQALVVASLLLAVPAFAQHPPKAAVAPAAPDAGDITGIVYFDYNGNGVRDTTALAPNYAVDVGVGGVTVTAYDVSGAVIATTTSYPFTCTAAGVPDASCTGPNTPALGSYTLNSPALTALPADTPLRIEFTDLPSGYEPAPYGTNNATHVRFVTTTVAPLSGVDFGLLVPLDYCQKDPSLVTPLHINGDTTSTTYTDTLEKYTYGGAIMTGIATKAQIGSTWGVAYARSTKMLYVAAFLKRHVGLGPNGLGAIYAVDPAGGTPTLFADLEALGASVGTVLSNTARGLGLPTLPQNDPSTFNQIGKVGLGDIDISDDDSVLYVVSLNDKTLYALNVPAATLAGSWIIPDPGCVGGAWRPFAVKFKQGEVYVGGVCDAQTSGLATDLDAYVYRFTPGPNSFTQVLSFGLDYPKGYVNSGCPTTTGWYPWSDDTTILNTCAGLTVHPQPVLSDIEFDNDGSMILGFLDRMGHQASHNSYTPVGITLEYAETGGDVLRAYNNNGTYVLESNGAAGPYTTAGAGNNQGPGGGEFYYQDWYTALHVETANGALAFLPGSKEVVLTALDPTGIYQGGVLYLSNTTGAQTHLGSAVYTGNLPYFGKSHGVGDVELLCNPAPIEIGNRVWREVVKNGIQDPGEPGVANVTVQLYSPSATLLATAVTDANGNYYFSSDPTGTNTASAKYNITGLTAGTSGFEVRIDMTQPALSGWSLTTANADVSTNGDIRDSDATLSGTTAVVTFATGATGASDHSLDIGFLAPVDFGDAPDTAAGTGVGNYNTQATDYGPSHFIVANLRLGVVDPDDDPGTLQNAMADADDTTGAPDDEDGVTTLPTIDSTTTSVTLNVNFYNFTGQYAYLKCWIDFNRDGDFLDTGEAAASPAQISLNSQQNVNLTFSGFGTPTAGASYLRCRIANSASEIANPTGVAATGEVEDYLVTIVGKDFGDAPDLAAGTYTGNYNTRLADSGPHHTIVPNLQLGVNAPDGDNGLLQNTAADADDTTNNGVADDEDGVTTLPTVTTASYSVPLSVSVLNNTGSDATVACWIDFNRDGDFLDAGEMQSTTVTSSPVVQTETLTFSGFAAPTAGTSYLRCRIANDAGQVAAPTGAATTGEVEDYQITILSVDLGDAPDTAAGTGTGNYNTTAADDGPRHTIVANLRLGSVVPDADNGTLQNPAANADDLNATDDEDGVITLPTINSISTSVALTVNTFNNTGSDATVACWIDFNRDGDFLDAGEMQSTTVTSSPVVQAKTLTFSGFAPPTAGTSYLRCRIANDAGEVAAPTGLANTGEVEDYQVTIVGVDLGDAPDTAPGTGVGNYNTLATDNGPRHTIVANLRLGVVDPDADPGTLQNAAANADDLNATDDEDGVASLPDIDVSTTSVALNVNFYNFTGLYAYLKCWIDFNRDGDFLDTGEAAASPAQISLNSQQNVTLTFSGFAAPTAGTSYLRCRIANSASEIANPTGVAATGEVEDYLVTITSAVSLGSFVWNDSNSNGLQDPGEPGIANATVELVKSDNTSVTDINGDPVAPLTTGANGFYYFFGLPPGSYKVRVTPGAGYVPTTPQVADPNTDVANDSNIDTGAGGPPYESGVIVLSVGGEPVETGGYAGDDLDNMRDSDGNMTVDFGFQVAKDYGDLPDTPYATLLASNGARHVIISGVRLGTAIDAEVDGQPNAAANGDDTSGAPDDEDGVQFTTPLVPGRPATITVTASVTGCLNAWVDFNGNGVLTDSGEQIANNQVVPAGASTLTVAVPASATGVEYSRFRFTQTCGQGGENPTGLASSGEVEDYVLAALGNIVWDDTDGNGVQDSGEPVHAGVTVKLLDGSGNPVLDSNGAHITTVTNASGQYEFPGLPAGSYMVEFVPPSGYSFTSPYQGGNATTDSDANVSTGRSAVVTLTAGEVNPDVDAGLVLATGVAIGNLVWCDNNDDGIWQNSEPGQDGVTVRLYSLGADNTPYTADDVLVATTVTTAGGYYIFNRVTPSVSYYVGVVKTTVPGACGSNSSIGGGGNPDQGDQDVAGGDDGVPGSGAASSLVVSGVWTPTLDGQTTTDSNNPLGYSDSSAYMTVDFGFTNGPNAVTLATLRAQAATFGDWLRELLRQVLGR